MSGPLVSVITPTLDAARHLDRCLDSVACQSYRRIEHIVVDGGSTDRSLDILRERPNVTWMSESDSGQASAINKGFAMASGAILGWLNADDVLTEQAVEWVVEEFERDRAVGWVFGDVEVVQGESRRVEKPARPNRPLTWAARNVAAQPGSFHSASALEEVGFLDESFHYMMDLELWLRMIDAGIRWSYVPQVLAIFDVHPGSKSGSVPHAEFLKEEARARFKSRRRRTGAVAVGRCAAWQAADRGECDDDDLVDFVASIEQDLGLSPDESDRSLAIAAARAERAILAVKTMGLGAAWRLVDTNIWRYPETRSRVRDVTVREIERRIAVLSRRMRRSAPDASATLL